MVSLVVATCPKCGASLKLESPQQALTCRYCGTTCLVAAEPVRAARPTPGSGPDPKTARAKFAIVAAVVLVGLGGALMATLGPHAASVPPKAAGNVAAAPVVAPSALEVSDSKGAPVVVQMFGDYQCPFTARAWSTIGELVAKYSGRIQLVWRHLPLPFHPRAMAAAEAALEAKSQLGEEGFWRMTDLLLTHRNELDQADLERHAATLGMNVAALRNAWKTGRHRKAIAADEAAAKAAGFSGTPAFLVKDVHLTGAQPLEKFVDAVEGALHGK
jgi:protein-disulfide isomerase